MSAEPLHVRVARALGWTDVQSLGPRDHGPSWHTPGTDLWVGLAPCEAYESPEPGYITADRCACKDDAQYLPIPPYGQDSPDGNAVTMPFLRYVRELSWSEMRADIAPARAWYASSRDLVAGFGATPGEALCNLVLALSDAGRLKVEPGPSDEAVR